MMDLRRLTELILQADFTYSEIEQLCGGYLDLRAERLENVLGNGTGAWQHRVSDLVAWADRQGLLNELYRGVLHYGGGKRVVQELILNYVDMPIPSESPPPTSYGSLERRFERMETNVHDRLTYVERELQRLSVAVEMKTHEATTISWPIVMVMILAALSIGGAITIMAALR